MLVAMATLLAARRIRGDASSDVPLQCRMGCSDDNANGVSSQSIGAQNGAVATPGVAPCIRWRMLRKDDGSLSLRIDHASQRHEHTNGQWHHGMTTEIPAEELNDQQSSLESVKRAMEGLASQCLTDHRKAIDRIMDHSGDWEDIQKDDKYHYLSHLSALYIQDCTLDPQRWLPPADLVLVFAESRTTTGVWESLLRHPEVLQQITHVEV